MAATVPTALPNRAVGSVAFIRGWSFEGAFLRGSQTLMNKQSGMDHKTAMHGKTYYYSTYARISDLISEQKCRHYLQSLLHANEINHPLNLI